MRMSTLVLIVLFTLTGLTMTITTKSSKQTSYHAQQLEAALIMRDATLEIKKMRLERGIAIDSYLDPLETGFIGTDAPVVGNSITTTLGSIDAKRTSTNPNFTALFIRYLKDLGVKKGDNIALNFSGSFPALNVSVIIALDVLGLNSVIQSSIGASTYGANIIDLNYLDMEIFLFNKGIIKRKSNLVSLGGNNDCLEGISSNTENFLTDTLKKYETDYEIIRNNDLRNNIIYRYDFYQDKLLNIKAFINIGGNEVAFGLGIKSYPNGLSKRLSTNVTKKSGLIDYFIRDDIPLIHMLNMIDLSKKNNMEYNKTTQYELGIGGMYNTNDYSQLIITLTILTSFIFLITDSNIRKSKESEALLYKQKTNWYF